MTYVVPPLANKMELMGLHTADELEATMRTVTDVRALVAHRGSEFVLRFAQDVAAVASQQGEEV
jgi:hypothetical protein